MDNTTTPYEPSLKEIQAKVAESGGALSPLKAAEVLRAQAAHDASQQPPAAPADGDKGKGKGKTAAA